MRRRNHFVESLGSLACPLSSGGTVTVPIVPGLLKHPTVPQLRQLLSEPDAVTKYTIAALRHAPWSILRQFDKPWLRSCLSCAGLRSSRARAISFLIA